MSSEMKADLRVAADEAVFFGAGFGGDEREDGLSVRRCDRDPAAVVGAGDVGEDAEAELLDVELEAAVVIADVDGGLEDAEVRAFRAFRASGRNGLTAGVGGGSRVPRVDIKRISLD